MTTFWSIAGTKTPKKYPGRGFLLQPTPNANENLFVNLALIRYCLDTTGGVWRGHSVCDSTSPGKNFVGRLGKKVVQKGPFGPPKGTFWTFQSSLLDSLGRDEFGNQPMHHGLVARLWSDQTDRYVHA